MIAFKDLVPHVAGQGTVRQSVDALLAGIAEAAKSIGTRGERDTFVQDLLNNLPALGASVVHIPGSIGAGTPPVGVEPPALIPPMPTSTAAGNPPPLDSPSRQLSEIDNLFQLLHDRISRLVAMVEAVVPLLPGAAPAPDALGNTPKQEAPAGAPANAPVD